MHCTVYDFLGRSFLIFIPFPALLVYVYKFINMALRAEVKVSRNGVLVKELLPVRRSG